MRLGTTVAWMSVIEYLASSVPLRSNMRSRRHLCPIAAALCLILSIISVAQPQRPAQVELFEKNARPLFTSKCQGCHNAKLKSGGLDFSSPEAIKEAASMGIFGKPLTPEESVLLRAWLREPDQDAATGQAAHPKLSPPFESGWPPGARTRCHPDRQQFPDGNRYPSCRSTRMITDADKNFWSFKPLSQASPPTPQREGIGRTTRSTGSSSPTSRRMVSSLRRRPIKPRSSAAPHSI